MKNWLDNLLSWATEVVERSVNSDLISYSVCDDDDDDDDDDELYSCVDVFS